MKIASYLFSPSPLICLLYACVGGVMLLLGYWQLQRADEKIQLQSAAQIALQKPPVPLAGLDSRDPGSLYARVSLVGTLEADRQFLWDNRIYQAMAGYEVITPFRLAETGQFVLVNRGWVPVGGSRQNLPDISVMAPDTISITGIWSRPSIGFSGGDAVNLGSDKWPRLLQHFAYSEIEQALGEPVLPGLVQVDRDVVAQKQRQIDAHLYADNWKPVANGPERHYGYAFQWFAMFIALTVLFAFLNTKRIPTQ